jgi:hypothetical protein
MVSRTEPLSVAIDPDNAPIVASESLLARFLLRELESSDGINDLLTLLTRHSKAWHGGLRFAGQ